MPGQCHTINYSILSSMFEFAPKVGPMMLMLMMLLLLVLSPVDSRWTRRPRRTTTPRSTTEKADRHQHVHHWPPLVAPPAPAPGPVQAPIQPPVHAPVPAFSPPQDVWKPSPSPRLIDSFDRRSADGEYEFRFQLDNGNTRYERAYWLPVGKELVLAKKGFYSVPLPNDQFSTTFYTADNRGYHVDRQTLSGERPLLPRSLEVPGVGSKMESVAGAGAGTKRNSISDPERNEQQVESVEEAVNGTVDDASVAGTERVPNDVSQVETETETETEPSTLANDILATEAADEEDDDDGGDDAPASAAPAPDDADDDEGDSN